MGWPPGLHGLRIRRIDLVGIMSAAVEPPDIVVAHGGDHLRQLGILAEKVFPGVGATAHLIRLILAVDGFFHPLAQDAGLVFGQQRIPAAAPNDLDDVPTGAPKCRFELLDDLAVAPNRPVQSLEIAVHHEDQVVQVFPARERNCAQRLGLIRLSVAEECPDFPLGRFDDAAIRQVTHEARLVDRHQGTEPHRHRRELPETRHQSRVRIGGKSARIDFLAEVVELVLA